MFTNSGISVSRETFQLLENYVELLSAGNKLQNLIGASTLDEIWDRHILDCAQLLRFETHARSNWIDIGSGAGLPGMVIAILAGGAVTLVEPRRLRAQFLSDTVGALGLDQVSVVHGKAEKVQGRFDVITARAVASIENILAMTLHLAHSRSIWVLPRGRKGQSELAEARRNWHGEFRSHKSLTDPDAVIITMSGVRAKEIG